MSTWLLFGIGLVLVGWLMERAGAWLRRREWQRHDHQVLENRRLAVRHASRIEAASIHQQMEEDALLAQERSP